MKQNKFWAAVSKTLAAVTAMLIVVLVLAPGVWAASEYKTLHKFGMKSGTEPNGLIFDQAGNLYGTTQLGGSSSYCVSYGCGTVFKLTPNPDGSWKETVLHSFCHLTNCDDGAIPSAGVIFDTAGNLYGTTSRGGTNGGGTVFKLTPNPDGSWKETVLYSFASAEGDGIYPYGGVVFDQTGNLYGTTGQGGAYDGGTVFELTPNSDGSWKEQVLHSFEYFNFPEADLIFDAAGNLYGTTLWGGGKGCAPSGCGAVFKLVPNPDGSWTEVVLHPFTGGKDGGNPDAGLIFDHAGNLYGVALAGGIGFRHCDSGCGVVFKLMPKPDGTWKENVLYSFCSLTNCRDGGGGRGTPGTFADPALIFDQAGNLYGTTYRGGAHGWGVLFKLTLGSDGKWKERVLHSFMDHPGAKPYAGLISDAAENLYGTTKGDGTETFGSVFEITP